MLESRRDSSLMSAMEAATVAVALAQPEEQRQPRCFFLGLHHIIAAHQKMPLPLRVDIPHSVHSGNTLIDRGVSCLTQIPSS